MTTSRDISARAKQFLSEHLELLSLVGLVALYFAWFAWPLVWSASESIPWYLRLIRKKYEYYDGLKNENLGYTLVRDFGEIQVYVRR